MAKDPPARMALRVQASSDTAPPSISLREKAKDSRISLSKTGCSPCFSPALQTNSSLMASKAFTRSTKTAAADLPAAAPASVNSECFQTASTEDLPFAAQL